MPYTNAVIQETMRITPLFPAGVPHVTSEDYNLGGYSIAKGTVVVSMTVAIHNDPDIWADPQVFLPERFLTADGSRNINHEAFFPFGVGKRACPGKHLAKHNLFIFVSSIFQRFSLSVGNSSGKVNLNPKQISSTLAPTPQELVFTPRSIPD
ncbi:unnamed protein product [Allacma fusca]|uniref:Cytochrome P450 n=1 Tax=Allacma fusca TaxID=39272 RepID=A0A8J2LS37_9HEXA|nr:unnamed protein product [Allacma fusca]